MKQQHPEQQTTVGFSETCPGRQRERTLRERLSYSNLTFL